VDRVTVAALLFAGVSVLATSVSGDGSVAARHACMLLLPLAVIAFPEAIEAGYRHSRRGFAHGGEGPTPAIVIRVVAWGLLIVLVAAHHCMPSAEHAAWTPHAANRGY
jgi:hypothetical protein